MKRRRLIWLLPMVLTALAGSGVVLFYRHVHPKPTPTVSIPDDTGSSRKVTEERMRAIGYVQ